MNRDELIEKMCDVYRAADSTPIAAALDVAMDELLKEFTNDEFWTVTNEPYDYRSDKDGKRFASAHGIAAGLANRRARFTRHEANKTPEERVTVISVYNHPVGGWSVQLDGTQVFWQASRKDAEIYRKGLIAYLKEKENQCMSLKTR